MSQFDFESLLGQAKAMQDRLSSAQEQLARKTVSGEAGGGMVTVQVNGVQEVLSVKLEPQCVDPRDIRMLEDLLVAAVNRALAESRALAQREMNAAAGLPLDALGGLGGLRGPGGGGA